MFPNLLFVSHLFLLYCILDQFLNQESSPPVSSWFLPLIKIQGLVLFCLFSIRWSWSLRSRECCCRRLQLVAWVVSISFWFDSLAGGRSVGRVGDSREAVWQGHGVGDYSFYRRRYAGGSHADNARGIPAERRQEHTLEPRDNWPESPPGLLLHLQMLLLFSDPLVKLQMRYHMQMLRNKARDTVFYPNMVS